MRFLRCVAVALSAITCKGSQDTFEHGGPSASAVAPSAAGLRLTVAPSAGEVGPIVRDALAKEAAERRRLVVYVGASWCEPCQRFHQAAERGELDGSLGNLTLLEFDYDRDGERLRSAGYASRYIPLFALPTADGTASGKQIAGAIKGQDALAFIVPRLKGLLAP